MGIRETKKDNSELFKWDGKPSAGQVFPLAAQHVLAAGVGCVTPAILVVNAANNAGGNVDMGLLIQMSLVFAALSTLLQLYGNKIRIGASGDHRREFCLRSDDDGNRRTGKKH